MVDLDIFIHKKTGTDRNAFENTRKCNSHTKIILEIKYVRFISSYYKQSANIQILTLIFKKKPLLNKIL